MKEIKIKAILIYRLFLLGQCLKNWHFVRVQGAVVYGMALDSPVFITLLSVRQV